MDHHCDNYILDTLTHANRNGNCFVDIMQLRNAIIQKYGPEVDGEAFEQLKQERQSQTIHIERGRVYLEQTIRAEKNIARFLANALVRQPLPVQLNVSDEQELNQEQRDAVRMALRHRISMILGGAGTGKSCLVRTIVESFGNTDATLLCAPTGKAAYALTSSTGCEAVTIHSALGVLPGNDLTKPTRELGQYQLIVIDEASMLTLEMAAGIFNAAAPDCHIVLVGDPNQLPPVGSGNLIADFLRLNVPRIYLTTVFRQKDRSSALFENVSRFQTIQSCDSLRTDSSFQFIPAQEKDVTDLVAKIGAHCFPYNASAVILSPFATFSDVSVMNLNLAMQSMLNRAGAASLICNGIPIYEQDRVMFTQNNRMGGYVNGEIGRLEHCDAIWPEDEWSVSLSNGNKLLLAPGVENHLVLAYAMTVHRSQGSSFDTVIIPLTMRMNFIMTRNMLYTALTRARKQVILVGDIRALDHALSFQSPPRNSMLVERVQALLERAA